MRTVKLCFTLPFIWLVFAQALVFGQVEEMSKHKFSFYVNDKEILNTEAEVSIHISGKTIEGKKAKHFYYFSKIDTSKKFDLIAKVGRIIFQAQDYPAWVLNAGTSIILGKLTRLKKLKSVADYNGMTQKDHGWEW